MSYATRRLLLRTKTFRYRRAQLQFTNHPNTTPASQICRQFHPSPFLPDDKPEGRKRGRPRKDKSAQSKPKIEESGNGLDQSLQGQLVEDKVQSSVSSELGVNLGGEIDRDFRKKVDQLTEAGDYAGLLDLANTEIMSNIERRELVQLVKKNMEVEDKARVLHKLAKLVEERPDDIEGAQELMKEAGMQPQDLFAPPTGEEAEAIRSDDKDVDLSDPHDIDRRFWESITGRSESDEDNWEQERIIRELMDGDRSGNSTLGTARDGNLQKYLARSVTEKQKSIEKSFGVAGRIHVDDARPEPPGFFNYEDDEAGPDEEFNQDDLPAKGHQELDLHREIREYARLAVWELPLLSKLKKPFIPPTKDQVLRFRYTTYLGEDHPAEKKVVMEFSPDALDLTEVERSKLIKIAAARYNPSTRVIKIACESFETPAQNKRYLGDLVEVLIREAKDPADTFEDLPFDFRHHRPKVVHAFPESWKLTPERRAELLAVRKERAGAEKLREKDNSLVDGLKLIPGGKDVRDRERWMESMKEEQALLALHDQEKLEKPLPDDQLKQLREREAALKQMEKVELKIDSTARRTSKRAKYLQRFGPEDADSQDNPNRELRL